MTRYRGKGTIARWDWEGRFLGTFADAQEFIGPHSMHIDSEGFVWVADRINEAHVDVHQMAMAPEGDICVASVYPEHGGELRGIEGPSFGRWERARNGTQRQR